jgi:hypothetical protein
MKERRMRRSALGGTQLQLHYAAARRRERANLMSTGCRKRSPRIKKEAPWRNLALAPRRIEDLPSDRGRTVDTLAGGMLRLFAKVHERRDLGGSRPRRHLVDPLRQGGREVVATDLFPNQQDIARYDFLHGVPPGGRAAR